VADSRVQFAGAIISFLILACAGDQIGEGSNLIEYK
jgi:hypothetical protein